MFKIDSIKFNETYYQFGKITSIIEKYLKIILGKNYENSGEQKEFEEALDKIEELFKFIKLSPQNEE